MALRRPQGMWYVAVADGVRPRPAGDVVQRRLGVSRSLTYRQIGESLYLSAKTVEHRLARIKRRSGVSTRSELLERL